MTFWRKKSVFQSNIPKVGVPLENNHQHFDIQNKLFFIEIHVYKICRLILKFV